MDLAVLRFFHGCDAIHAAPWALKHARTTSTFCEISRTPFYAILRTHYTGAPCVVGMRRTQLHMVLDESIHAQHKLEIFDLHGDL